MSKIKFVLFCFLFMLIFLCGCSTPYQSEGLGGGYSDFQLDENTFKVSFRGNGLTDFEKATDYCLLRCAEVSIENGFNYFVLVANDQSVSTYSHTSPTTTSGYIAADGNMASGQITTSGGHTYIISKPKTENVIVCLKEKVNGYYCYDAKIIYRSLKKKYGID